jgi:protein-S-isoprenylcysteine O-methyltransferase Ste14
MCPAAYSASGRTSSLLATRYGLRPVPELLGLFYAVAGLALRVLAVRDTAAHAELEARQHHQGVDTGPPPTLRHMFARSLLLGIGTALVYPALLLIGGVVAAFASLEAAILVAAALTAASGIACQLLMTETHAARTKPAEGDPSTTKPGTPEAGASESPRPALNRAQNRGPTS